MQISVQVSLNTFCDKLEEIADLMIFSECFRGPHVAR